VRGDGLVSRQRTHLPRPEFRQSRANGSGLAGARARMTTVTRSAGIHRLSSPYCPTYFLDKGWKGRLRIAGPAPHSCLGLVMVTFVLHAEHLRKLDVLGVLEEHTITRTVIAEHTLR
jgi:hypothetical protein